MKPLHYYCFGIRGGLLLVFLIYSASAFDTTLSTSWLFDSAKEKSEVKNKLALIGSGGSSGSSGQVRSEIYSVQVVQVVQVCCTYRLLLSQQWYQ